MQIVAASNFKQRARMSMLYYHAELHNYAVIGTADANEFTVTNGTLANLEKDGSATTAIAANSTTLGQTYEQWCDGYPYLYLGFTSEDGAAVSVPVVKATLVRS